MLKNILATAKAITKDNLSSKTTLFFVIIFPIFLTLIFAIGFGGINHVSQIVITNQYSLAKYLNSSDLFIGIQSNMSIHDALLHNYIYVKITNRSTFDIYYPSGESYLIPSLKALISSYNDSNTSYKFNLNEGTGFTYVEYIISGMIGVIALSNGVFGVTGVAAGYYRDKLVERLAASPLKSYEWVTSLMIYEIIITLISIAPLLLLAVLFGFIPAIGVAFILFLILGTLMFSGLGAIIFGLTPKDKLFVANVAANILVFPLMFLSNSFFYTSSFPPLIRSIIEYQPVSVLNNVIRQTIVYQQLPQMWEIIYVLIFMVITIYLGSKLLRLREIE
ncbi:ABC transporter permease [Acidianus manzaensis]|uniref:ABC transporter n=1 Tax=Acidianus manzaensis TaxID=282676 RepID=A0A1W6JXD9_9CREN|nr:ABC transporter permease [Acidianus manzaensis]ARM74946.1 ABC transporter [Acidianus manzaensis]